jgi:hypothetical protein
LNTLAFIVRGVSPISNRPLTKEDKDWMTKFDYACMIFFSITDAFTSFGITILFYQIGKNEYSKSNNAKELSHRDKSEMPLH